MLPRNTLAEGSDTTVLNQGAIAGNINILKRRSGSAKYFYDVTNGHK